MPWEHARVAEATGHAEDDLFAANPWYEWGPYHSERHGARCGGLLRGGDGLELFPHDHARSRAYRWDEDGMAGVSDIRHELCLALALWNGGDPILKERMFGLTGPQGNHGEDVKEYWWSWTPCRAMPGCGGATTTRRPPSRTTGWSSTAAARTNRSWNCWTPACSRGPLLGGRRRLRQGVADRGPDAGLLTNPGPDEATIEVLPTLWFRNTWSWDDGPDAAADRRRQRRPVTVADHPFSGFRLDACRPRRCAAPGAVLRQRDQRAARVRVGVGNRVSEGRDQRPRRLRRADGDPGGFGTKAALRYRLTVARRRDGGSAAARPPAGADVGSPQGRLGSEFDEVVGARAGEADEFYAVIPPDDTTPTTRCGSFVRPSRA